MKKVYRIIFLTMIFSTQSVLQGAYYPESVETQEEPMTTTPVIEEETIEETLPLPAIMQERRAQRLAAEQQNLESAGQQVTRKFKLRRQPKVRREPTPPTKPLKQPTQTPKKKTAPTMQPVIEKKIEAEQQNLESAGQQGRKPLRRQHKVRRDEL